MATRKPEPVRTVEPVDAKTIARRLGKSQQYVAANLSKRPDFPDAQPYELNGGRWWHWAEVAAWCEANGYSYTV